MLSSFLKWTLEAGNSELEKVISTFFASVSSSGKWDNNLISYCENMCVEQCLAHIKHYISIYCYDYKDIDHYFYFEKQIMFLFLMVA